MVFIDSLYLRYEAIKMKHGLGGLMQQMDIAGDDLVFPVSNGCFLQLCITGMVAC